MTPGARAYEEIRARVCDARLPPGMAIHEVALAAELGVSRLAVHEALIRLQQERLVTPSSPRGFRVAVPAVDDMRELFEIVGALEAHAVRRIVLQGGQILIRALQEAYDAQATALAQADLAAWSQADFRFHELLREGADNRRLRALFQQYSGQLQQVRAATLHLRRSPRRSLEEHGALLAAIRSGDAERALRIHLDHRSRSDAVMLAAIEALHAEVDRRMAERSADTGA